MENKVWNEYSKEDQNNLLQHWWYYYGKIIFTMEEWDQFNKLIERDSNEIFELAVVSYINGLSSQPLIYAMRRNEVNELMLRMRKLKTDKFYEEAKKEFINILVKTYNKPEPSIPIKEEVMIEQAKEIIKKKNK